MTAGVLAPERATPAGAPGAAGPGIAPGAQTHRPGRPTGAPGRPGSRRVLRRAMAVSAVLVVGSLLLVVGANAYLTQGQVRLTRLQQQVTAASGTNRDLELQVAKLENPSRIVSQAEGDGLEAPSRVSDLPQVDLPPGSSGTPSAVTSSTGSPRRR